MITSEVVRWTASKRCPHPLFGLGPEDDLFQNFDVHPQDMEFEVVRRTGETFDNLLEMTASFSPDDPPGKNSKLCVQEKNSGKIVGFIKLASPLINAKPRNEWLGRPLQTENLEEMRHFNASHHHGVCDCAGTTIWVQLSWWQTDGSNMLFT